jgi:hypothetical protein
LQPTPVGRVRPPGSRPVVLYASAARLNAKPLAGQRNRSIARQVASHFKKRMRTFNRSSLIIAVSVIASNLTLAAQAVSDREFRVAVKNPAYAVGTGPIVCVDEAHANLHTIDNLFLAFGELLRQDGFIVRASPGSLTAASLSECSILVVANAQSGTARIAGLPSAFTAEEIGAAHRWVRDGGRLLLIADHMPLAAAAAPLAAAFGMTFSDGFAVEGAAFTSMRSETSEEASRDPAFDKPTIFRTADGTLRPHAISSGRNSSESVTAVRTFVGQAFQAPDTAEPLLVFPATFVALTPDKAWQFGPETRRIPVGGWLQGAVMRLQSGRAAFFGEAAMFSARFQLVGTERRAMGMNAAGAEQNFQFVLNVMHWLSGVL